MKDDKTSGAERDTRNKGLQHEEKELHNPEKRTPHGAADEDAPAPPRPMAPEEEPDDISNMENPPQSDGPRERNNDAV